MNSNEIMDLINNKKLEIKRLRIEVEELKRNLNNQLLMILSYLYLEKKKSEYS